jgi:SAM-dependent methyltransferase
LGTLSQLCGATPEIKLALLEENSTFATIAKQRFGAIVTSEYLDHRFTSGTYYAFHNQSIRHESITDLSYQDAELDVLVHNDVLEHVFDFRKALSESARVLKKGGTTLFTTPVFVYQTEHLLRGSMNENGDITNHLPPEYHGDTLRPEGVYTFHYFGPGIIDDLLEAGFSEAAIGVDYDAFIGFTSCNHPSESEGNMMPIVIYGRK